jgi:phage terminase small subunit
VAKKLTAKQQRFVEEYCADFNATQAAIRSGYSAKTAYSIGWENLRKPEIAEAVGDRLDEMSMTASEATKRLTDWGRGDLSPFLRITADGEAKIDLSTSEAQDALALVRKIKQTENTMSTQDGTEYTTTRTEIELHDAKDATIQLAKIRGLYVDRHELTGKDGGPIETREMSDEEVTKRLTDVRNRLVALTGAPSTNGRNGH